MLKTTSINIGDKNPEQGGKRIQVENWDEKKLIQKSCKSQLKDQKIAKFKKWIQIKKIEASSAKNLDT